MPRPSIRLRLTLWYGGLFLLAGAILLALNYALVSRNLPSSGTELRPAVEDRLQLAPGDLRGDVAFEFPLDPGRGAVVSISEDGPVTGQPGDAVYIQSAGVSTGDGTQPPPGRIGFMQFFDGVVSEVKVHTLRQIVWQSSLALALTAIVSVWLGWFVAGRMLRPVHEIAATARRITDEHLEDRIALAGPSDELRELADQFDAMLDRLQSAFEAQREFVANASHELRTPLTIIRTELDVTLEDEDVTREQLAETAAVVRRAIDRTESLIDRLLILARAEQPLERDEPVDLDDAVRRALDARARDLEALDLRVDLELGHATAVGDPVLLDRLVSNLVDNAVEHNEHGGWMRVATSADAGAAHLDVANSGPRIPDDAVPRLFERFARLDPPRTGTGRGHGLGLSIVRAIVHAHRGTATARALPEGGFAVTVGVPFGPASAA